MFFAKIQGATDGGGIARFPEVPVGAWWVGASVPGGGDYLRFVPPGISIGDFPPSADPVLPAPRFTVSRPDETLSVDVTLPRGDRVYCQLVVDQDGKPGGLVHFEEISTKVRFEALLNKYGYGDRLLPAGRWRVWLDPRAGELLREFEVDHVPVPDSSAVIETKGEGKRIDLEWRYVAPCQITGMLRWDVGDDPPGVVVAHLVRPGSWMEDVQRRGGTITDRVPARTEEDGSYTLFLLDGAWRLAPEGPRVLSSTPDHVDLELAPGDESRQDFFVKAKSADDDAQRSVLLVTVTAPGGGRLSEAHVAIWPVRETSEKTEPLMRADTGKGAYPAARFVGIPAGNYRIVAGHRNYLEGRTVFENFIAKPGEAQVASVVLSKGAEIAAVAKDEKGSPARGIELRIERKGPPAPSELDDEVLRESRAHRSATTDETGRLKIGGLDAGTYGLEAALTEQRQGTHFVRIEGAEPPGAAMESALAEGEKKDVALRLVPAASITAVLACEDRARLSEKTAIRVLPLHAGDPDEEPAARTDAVFARDDLILTGRDLDHLFAGPLPDGTYTIALRPDGFDRWTLVPGTEDPDRALPLLLEAGRSEALGPLDVDCGPTVRVEPDILTKEAVPDLHDAALTVSAHLVPGTAKDAAPAKIPASAAKGAPAAKSAQPAKGAPPRKDTEALSAPRQEPRRGFIRLRGLPVGTVTLELAISHPYFVPSTIAVKPGDYLLERGREATARIEVPRLGGAIQFDASLGAVVALLSVPGEDAPPTRYPLDPKARAVGIPPGHYDVGICSDLEGTHPLAAWKDLLVEPAHTVFPR